jgi:hypothetical protein
LITKEEMARLNREALDVSALFLITKSRRNMRKEWSIRLRLPEHQGRQIHELSLKESRSQSSMISILVAEALTARRATSASTAKLVAAIRGEASDFDATA